MDRAAEIVAEGRRLQRARRYPEALAAFGRALALDPDSVEALGNRGSVLGALRRYGEALGDYDRALGLAPGNAALLYNRAKALKGLGRLAEALESFDRALAAAPERVEFWSERGNLLRDLKRGDEALASYDRAIALAPNYAAALYNRGNLFWVDRHAMEPALKDFERAFAVDPDCPNLRGDLLHLRMHVGEWRDFDRQKALVDEGVRAGRRVIGPFAYQALSASPADLKMCAEIYAADRFPPRAALSTVRAHGRGKMRIGYLSGEFRQQATAFLTAGLYEAHDKSKFELIAFDNGWSDHSPLRQRLENAFDRFVDISQLSNPEAAAAIAAGEIDILVSLNGYFGETRMAVFAARPAPIQVNYLGFPGTLGAPYIDYILADRTVIPDDERRFYTEQVVTLPDSYQVNDSRRGLPANIPTRAACGLPQNSIVFCNFNQSYKLTPDIFASWMRILGRVPKSVLWLLESNAPFAHNIRREAAAAGIDPGRIILAPMTGVAEHLARLTLPDLFLDTEPYNAHTTASDALWAGVPLVTCRGTSFPGRVAQSLLGAIGLPELVAENREAYEEMAVSLAHDRAALQTLRTKLQNNRSTAPLFDTAGFARHIETAYRTMWETFRAGRPPGSFAVNL